MPGTNEPIPRVKIDAQFKDQDWNPPPRHAAIRQANDALIPATLERLFSEGC